MKLARTAARLATAYLILFCSQAAVRGQAIFDDFNRSDSPVVGNGWSESGNAGELMLSSGRVAATGTGGDAGIYRPFSFGAPVLIVATFTEASGLDGRSHHWGNSVAIRNDGTTTGGYRLVLDRDDSTLNNSTLLLLDAGTILGTFASPVQFGAQLTGQFVFNPDGSVLGVVDQPGSPSFVFNFGPHAIASSGNSVALTLGFPDSRSTTFIFPTLDNVLVTNLAGAVPEPATYGALGSILAAGLIFARARWRQRTRRAPN